MQICKCGGRLVKHQSKEGRVFTCASCGRYEIDRRLAQVNRAGEAEAPS